MILRKDLTQVLEPDAEEAAGTEKVAGRPCQELTVQLPLEVAVLSLIYGLVSCRWQSSWKWR